MPFHPKNRSTSPIRKRVLITVLLFVFGSVVFSVFNGFLMRITAPLWTVEARTSNGFWSMIHIFDSKRDLILENEALKRQVASDILLLEESKAHDSAFESFKSTYAREGNPVGIAAGILVRPPETPYDILVVGAGKNDGVNIGMSVTLPEGAKIGTVLETYSKTSKILLYSANDEKTEAILERNAVPIELIGQGGGGLVFNLPREMAVSIGDKIIEPTIDGAMIGIVRNIDVSPTDSFKKVLVESVAPLNTLRFVLILP